MRPPDAIWPEELYENVDESVFQSHVIHEAHERGYRVYHHTSVGAICRVCGTRMNGGRIVTSKGFPDLVIARKLPTPRLIYAELKKKGRYLEPDQKVWRDILLANGVEWYLWRPANWKEVLEVLS